MDGLRIGDLARPLAPLTPDDTLARAAELLRSAPFDVLPVVSGTRLEGIVTPGVLADAARAIFEGLASPEQVRVMPLSNGLITPVSALPAQDTLDEAARALQWGVNSLPVVDAGGDYVGMLSLADVVAAISQSQRPASVGGMATPLGVYLTTGTLGAGARGSLGLMMAGAALALGLGVAMALTMLIMLGIERLTGIPVRAALESVPVGPVTLNRYDIWNHVVPVLQLAIFVILLRLSPLAGYHAAEHQVVHTIEADRPLTPENVQRFPRAHPRCGTRLFAVGVLLVVIGEGLPLADPWLRYGLAAVAVVLWWRKLGHHLQNWITTKPPSPRQVQSAIAAGETLLARYREAPPRRLTLWRRLYYMGLPQVLAGAALVAILAEMLLGGIWTP